MPGRLAPGELGSGGTPGDAEALRHRSGPASSTSPHVHTTAADAPEDPAACAGKAAGEKRPCYEGLLLRRLSSAGIASALEALKRFGEADRDVARDGHVYAHAIGRAAYETAETVGETFARCSEIYQSGCYHGVIQAYFEDVARGDDPEADDADRLCAAYRGQGGNRWLLFQCVHGMGHGLMSIHGHDLPRALRDCDLLSESWDRESCYGGAFMENVVNATAPHHGGHSSGRFKALDPRDPLYPCSVVEPRYVAACYQMQTSVILFHNKRDFAAAARVCDGAPVAMRPSCYQSLGRDISSTTLQDHGESIRLCSLGNPRYQPWCYVGLVKNFVDLTARTEDGFAFCRRAPGRGNKLKCYEAVGEQIAVLEGRPEERAARCRQSDRAFEEACRFGARLNARPPAGLPSAS